MTGFLLNPSPPTAEAIRIGKLVTGLQLEEIDFRSYPSQVSVMPLVTPAHIRSFENT
jgi:hypothetical protein